MPTFCKKRRWLLLASLLVVPCVWGQAPRESHAASAGYVGNDACAHCHSAIYESYKRTAMARASGPAAENFISGDFLHKKSGVHYRVYAEDGRVWLNFDRPGDPSLKGKRELLYYIGSGHRGRSYLFETDGFLFESPVNWYANEHVWDMAPAYQDAREIPLNLPAYPSCLQCHVSGMQAPAKGTENLYPKPVFSYSGVACERCHGPGAAHIRGGSILNPAKLSPERRDSVCMQCHLEGKVAIERAGRHVYEYKPGDLLSDYVRYYVLANSKAPGLGAVSQVEALAQSGCKRKSGDAMSCTSCHDPHSSPSALERVSYFRSKCLACHAKMVKTQHHPEQPDCTACHMPASHSTDIAHTQVTDHRIPRVPEPQLEPDLNAKSSSSRLIPFPYSEDAERDVRDMALAWEVLADNGMNEAAPEAASLLDAALKQSPNDPALLSARGYLEQKQGSTIRAREFYEKALAQEPDLIDAAANLGVIEANSGRTDDALRLWRGAFGRAPDKSGLGMNIARVLCDAGQFDNARSAILRVLQFNPDLAAAKEFLQRLNRTPSTCAQ